MCYNVRTSAFRARVLKSLNSMVLQLCRCPLYRLWGPETSSFAAAGVDAGLDRSCMSVCVLCFSCACVVPPITARGGIKVCPLYRCAIIVHLSARPLHLSWCAIRRWGGDTQHTAAFCIGSRRMPCDRLPSVVVIEKRCAQTIARERVSICSQHGSRARAGRERDWYCYRCRMYTDVAA